jgi:translation initiation factor 2 subunit 1
MVKLQEYPEISELVIGAVRDVKNFGAFISLNEYEGKEGFIHIAEVATGWVKYIRDYVKEGQIVVCKVLAVDPSKGHIDLSLKQVNEHQRRLKIQDWKNEQKAEKLFELLAAKLEKEPRELYEDFGFKLIDTFGTLYRAFEESAIDEESLTDEGFNGKWLAPFIDIATENIVPPYVNIDGYVDLMCPLPDGIEHVKKALLEAEKSTEDTEIIVQYIGAPKYRIKVKAPDYKTAEEELKDAAQRAINYISKNSGTGEFHRKDE